MPLQFYSRRKPIVEPVHVQEVDPVVGSDFEQTILNLDDLDFLISLRKGTRKCTQHPISNFVSFENLSPSHKAFLTHLNLIQIPKTVHEALMDKN